MYASSYDHPALQLINVDRLQTELKKELHTSNLTKVEGHDVYMVTGKSQGVSAFHHPVIIDNYGEPTVCIDARAFVRINRNDEVEIKSKSDYDFAVLRAELELVWFSGNRPSLAIISHPAGVIYCNWIAQTLTRALDLSPEETMKVSIVAATYFWMSFRTKEDLEAENDLARKLSSFVVRCTGLPAQTVMEVLEQMAPVYTVQDFIEQISAVTRNPELSRMDRSSFSTIMSTSWRGAQSREISILASGYPPAMIAMVVSATLDRSFRKTSIQQLLETKKRTVDAEQFVKSVKTLVKNSLE